MNSKICSTVLITALVAVTACNKQMPVPESLQSESETLTVEGKKAMAKEFKIGDIQVKDVKRKGKSSSGVSAGGVASAEKSKQRFTLSVAASGQDVAIECEIQDSSGSVGFSGSSESNLNCTFADWTLALTNDAGSISGGGSNLELSAWSSSKLMPRPSGFTLKTGDDDVAAITKEQMLLRTGIEPDLRVAVAAAAAALLVYADTPA